MWKILTKWNVGMTCLQQHIMHCCTEASIRSLHLCCPSPELDMTLIYFHLLAGNVSLWKVALVGEMARRWAHAYPGPLRQITSIPDALLFMVGSHLHLTPAFYRMKHLYNPLRVVYSTPHIGNQSYSEADKCYCTVTGELLHTEYIRVVCVDPKTRKPKLVTDAVRDFIGKLYSPSEIPEPVKQLQKPRDTFSSKYLVKWSNADYYSHSNHSQYHKYAVDGVSDAIKAGAVVLPVIDGATSPQDGGTSSKLPRLQIKNARGLYQGETKPGDELDLCVWQSSEDNTVIYVQIERQGTSVFQTTFNLHDTKL